MSADPAAPATFSPDALSGRLFEAGLATCDILTVYLGERLGLYQALAKSGPMTSTELAKAAGIHERYAREWLEQQAVGGFLAADDFAKPAGERRFTLPPGHAEVLINPESGYSMTPLARTMVSFAQTLPKVLEAFKTGGGVRWEDFGIDMLEAQGDFNRPWLLSQLGQEFLPAIPDVHARLQSDQPARVADVGCGVGWAGIAIARAYPRVQVDGIDPDERSCRMGRAYADQKGVGERVAFQQISCADVSLAGSYDLVLSVECIHDLPRPVEVLSSMKRMLAPGGSVLIADEKACEEITPGDPFERFLYGASVLCCLPTGMSEQPSAATGTVIRPGTMKRYGHDAGFGSVTVLEQIVHPSMRFYQLRP